jgi:hypothetical protein
MAALSEVAYAARKKPQRKPDVIQLPLLDPDEK